MNESWLFFVLAGLYAVLLVAGIIDAIGDWQFWPSSYATGVTVLRQDDVSLRIPGAPIGTVFETENGKFKFVAPDRLLVRQRFRFGRSRGQLRGTITWVANTARVEARLPLVYVASFAIVLLFFALLGLEAKFPPQLLIFLLVALVVTWANVAWTRRMMARVLEEYRQFAGASGPHA